MDLYKEITDLQKRLSKVEGYVIALMNTVSRNKEYDQADIQGVRAGLNNITPYTETKTAYIGDTEVIFTPEVNGNLSLYITDSEGNTPEYTVNKTAEYITVAFKQPLEYVTTITITIN